jgi:hypothetical protein
VETPLVEAQEAMERKYVLAAQGVDLEQLFQFVAEPHITINKLTIFVKKYILSRIYRKRRVIYDSVRGGQTHAPKKGGCCDDD